MKLGGALTWQSFCLKNNSWILMRKFRHDWGTDVYGQGAAVDIWI